MQKQPLISVIVPVYNVKDRLPLCLSGIQNQTFQDFECILVDDGSTDGCAAICDEISHHDKHFRTLHKKNGGLSSARNAGIAAARGQYIIFLDSDDEIAPHTLEYAIQAQTQHPNSLVWWDYTRNPETFLSGLQAPFRCQLTNRHEQEPFVDYTLSLITVWNKLFSAYEIQSRHLLFDLALGHAGIPGEDNAFMQLYIQNVYGEKNFAIAHIQVPLYHYYLNSKSLTGQNQAIADPENDFDPPRSGYCAVLEQEYNEKLALAPQLLEGEPFVVACMVRTYLRSLAYGIWSAQQLGERLPKTAWKTQTLSRMLRFCKQNRIYTPYYLPFKLGSAGFIGRFYGWDIRRSVWFFRFRLLFKLLLPGWQEPPAFQQ